MIVYVRNADGTALMPCTEAKEGKAYLYATLRQMAPLSTVYGYETATYRKYRGLPKTQSIDDTAWEGPLQEAKKKKL